MIKLLVFGFISLFGLFLMNQVATEDDLEKQYKQYAQDFEDILSTKDNSSQKEKANALNNKTDELKQRLNQSCSDKRDNCYKQYVHWIPINNYNDSVENSLNCFDAIVNLCAEYFSLENIQQFVARMAEEGVPGKYENLTKMVDYVTKLANSSDAMNSSHVEATWESYQASTKLRGVEEEMLATANEWVSSLYILMKARINVTYYMNAALKDAKYISLEDFFSVNKLIVKGEMHEKVADGIRHAISSNMNRFSNTRFWVFMIIIICVVFGVGYYFGKASTTQAKVVNSKPKATPTQSGVNSRSAQKSSSNK